MAEESVVVAPAFSDSTAFPEAFERIEPEMAALPDEEITIVNVDIVDAVTTVLGKWSVLSSLRPQIERDLPSYNLVRFDKLPDYARALWQAHALHHKSSPSATAVQMLTEEGSQLREQLLSDAWALVRRGLVKEEAIRDLKGPVSSRGLAQHLSSLAGTFRENWSSVKAKTAVQEAEIDRANAVAHQLVMAVGEREQAPVVAGETAKNRQRAYTLFMRAYDDARRAVGYLRAEAGDADEFAPSLYTKNGGGNTSKKTEQQKAPAQAPAASSVLLPAAESSVPVGMPGSNPLLK